MKKKNTCFFFFKLNSLKVSYVEPKYPLNSKFYGQLFKYKDYNQFGIRTDKFDKPSYDFVICESQLGNFFIFLIKMFNTFIINFPLFQKIFKFYHQYSKRHLAAEKSFFSYVKQIFFAYLIDIYATELTIVLINLTNWIVHPQFQ